MKALQSEHEKTRLHAIRSLRVWLPIDPNNHAALEMEVARIFPDEDVNDVVELLWAFLWQMPGMRLYREDCWL